MRTMADLENNIAYDDEEINEKPMVIITRAYDHSIDAPFVFASWRNSIWFDKERNESVASEFFRLANREMKNLIAQPNCKIKIACAKDDSTFIIGYSVMCDETIEWVYVKEKYRNKKIASLLVAGFNTVAEPSTIIGESIVRNKKLKIKTRTKEARELGIEISRAPEFRG